MQTVAIATPVYRSAAPLASVAAVLAAAMLLCCPSLSALAQTATPAPPLIAQPANKSAYWLFNPTPRHLMREMSTDRPDTTESPHTVDAGHIQLELSFIDWTYDRRNEDGVTTRSLAVAPVLIKFGLTNSIDLQIGLDPYTDTHIKDRATGDSDSHDGFGDTLLRVKFNIWGNDAPDEDFGGTSLAIMPYVSFPTATDGLGSDHTDWGIIIPLGLELPGEFGLGAMIEFDFSRSASDDRTVVDLVHTLTLGHTLIGDLSGYIEYAGFANLNHDQRYRAYFDAGLTYALTPDLQLDTGLRIGLTQASDDIGLFVGMSYRF